MKSNETKEKFIELRAKGLSYAKIAEKLNISKSTCSAWEKDLSDRISQLKQDQLTDLYNQYGMLKEARIKALGRVISKIDQAIDEADFSAMTPAQLLDFRLKYQQALNDEYVPTTTGKRLTMNDVNDCLGELAERARRHELNDQSAKELQALTLIANSTNEKASNERDFDALGSLSF